MLGKLIVSFASAISYIFPYHTVSSFLSRLRTGLYTGWVRREFKAFGKKSYISPCFRLLKGAEYIQIGNGSSIGKGVQLTAWDSYRGQHFTPSIVVGDNCYIGDDAHITAIDSIRLGNNVLMGKKILITDNSHGEFSWEELQMAPIHRPLHSKGPVHIDDNVWIGEKASIMPGVHIGKGAIIAANAVVTKDVPSNSMVAGVPAIVVRVLNDTP